MFTWQKVQHNSAAGVQRRYWKTNPHRSASATNNIQSNITCKHLSRAALIQRYTSLL